MKTSSRSPAVIAVAESVSEITNLPRVSGFDPEFAQTIDGSTLSALLALTKTNMQEIYNSAGVEEWAWRDEGKRNQLASSKMRFLIARGAEQHISAFMAFKFLLENGIPVIYVYELQVRPEHAGKGLGSHLVDAAMHVCKTKAPGIKRLVLTCFRHNTGALSFYKKLGFKEEPHSPSDKCYCILGKQFG